MKQSEIREQLPQHLRQFVGSQNYQERYTARDQAVWRLVMKLLVEQLKDSAHPVYFDGLRRTGISLESIPTIDEMNACLARLGWRAIVVDGFIPPQAFMELQSLKVLAIALDMRSVEHILYTPAPDIIHEAAGHAPIIADVEYSDYLQRFGEVGMKALYNQYDIALYEAVRELSIVKENPGATATELDNAQARLDELLANPGEPSELALLTRLHWWTVEYGLVGEPNHYKIFGAGLLSSLSESMSCLDDTEVKKLPLTVDAINTPYDITNPQPQLFVTKSCRHLTQILDEFAATMSFTTGGTGALQAAARTGVVTTAKLSSGLEISGKFTEPMTNAIGEVIYYRTEGPSQLALHGKELENHGTEYHAAGFGSPLGRICNLMKPLENASEYELQELGIRRDEAIRLEFLSGITVQGHLRNISKDHATVLIMTIDDCTVTGPEGEILFDPSWGKFDMAVGDTITATYAGSADPTTFDVYPGAACSATVVNQSNSSELEAFTTMANFEPEQAANILEDFPDSWLLHIEMLEQLSVGTPEYNQVLTRLQQSATTSPLVRQYLTHLAH
jgi:phenylalanine-4-hydroxylase